MPQQTTIQQSFEERSNTFCACFELCQQDPSEKAIHDVRVAARRLRAVLAVIAPFLPAGMLNNANKQLARLLGKLNGIRDAQVAALVATQAGHPASLVPAFGIYLQKKAKQAAAKATRMFEAGNAERFALDEIRTLPAQTAPFLAGIQSMKLLSAADDNFAKCQKTYAHINPAKPATLHKLRLRFKKFRYTIELLSPREAPLALLPTGYFEQLQSVQTYLGDIQDADVMRQMFAKWVKNAKGVSHPQRALKKFDVFLSQKISLFQQAPIQPIDLWRPTALDDFPWQNSRQK